jgi:hypothetical protein
MFSNLFHIFAVAPAQCEKPFLGLTNWFHFLPTKDFVNSNRVTDCTIHNFNFLSTKSDIALILLAVVDDLLRIAGIVAVAFVIYGGFQYVASQGQSERTARAQNTITDALIGLAVAILAVGIVSFLGARLGGS